MSVERQGEIKAAGARGIRRFLKFVGWVFAVCAALVIFGIISRYFEERSFKKSQTEEFFRRQHMTSEQRIAEDQAREKAASEKIISEKVAAIRKAGELVCKAAWLDQLKDPYSAKIEGFDSSVDRESFIFYADITGRAKNSFGAYIPGNWVCSAYMQENGKMKVSHISATP
jgi:hypothetical protein